MPDIETKPSPIQGTGVFAARPFASGEHIRRANVVREVTEQAPLRPDQGEQAEHCDYPDDRVMLWGAPDRYYNHSCDPNAYAIYADVAVVDIVARRPIARGEEITLNYLINNPGGDAWPCHCGATRCLGMTAGRGFFGLPVEHQREYLPLLADWFVARHREAIAALRRGAAAG
jgi:SET domain-containing protein